ncbi:hypothetical protein [Curtobacterium sp. PhB146]|uniref:hypothetical protein n=1 Tax=Curtobacterium sp. PhB146 TaxID=2485187 RepID=UPI00104C051B|nr:hypothetical protein [Curtobacterium sp. PhB146]TCU48344.1 hypothetical protein EDF33_102235 [Curtobacterium sp. PhB146]
MPLNKTGSTRLKGNALSLTIDGVDYWVDITSAKITPGDADKDVVTFYDAANGGGSEYVLNMTAIQSLDPASLWRYAWDNSGKEVDYTYAPKGNTDAPRDDAPWFVGKTTIGTPPEVGGEAGADKEYTSDLAWKCDGKPKLVTTAPATGE